MYHRWWPETSLIRWITLTIQTSESQWFWHRSIQWRQNLSRSWHFNARKRSFPQQSTWSIAYHGSSSLTRPEEQRFSVQDLPQACATQCRLIRAKPSRLGKRKSMSCRLGRISHVGLGSHVRNESVSVLPRQYNVWFAVPHDAESGRLITSPYEVHGDKQNVFANGNPPCIICLQKSDARVGCRCTHGNIEPTVNQIKRSRTGLYPRGLSPQQAFESAQQVPHMWTNHQAQYRKYRGSSMAYGLWRRSGIGATRK